MTAQRFSKEGVYSCPTELSSSKPLKVFQCDIGSSFTYTGKKRNIFWKEAGISLFFPEADRKVKIMFSIKLVSDGYILPPEYEDMLLVSSIYHIRASDTLPAPVRIRMDHCAVVEEDNDLTFMVAHGKPPYQFIPLRGGVFPQGEFYGEIELNKFSFFSIFFKKRRRSIRLAVHIAYYNKKAHFIATKNLEPHIAAVKKKYYDATDLDDYLMKCPSSTTEIVLSVPEATSEGWIVKPVFSPAKITMDTIFDYQRGTVTPNIKLSKMWKGQGSPKTEVVEFRVEGGDLKSFLLTCEPHLPTTSEDVDTTQSNRRTSRLSSLSSDGTPTFESRPTLRLLLRFPTQSGEPIDIIERIGTKNRNLCIHILKDENGSVINSIEAKHCCDPYGVTQEVFQRWLAEEQRTWTELVNALNDIKLRALAKEIEDNLHSLQ